jgi:large subunit ribosomal protein L17
MRHLRAGRTLNRNATHRLALMRNLTSAIIRSKTGRIITTVEKAKEARPFIEKLITLAKQGTLQARRLAEVRLGPCAHSTARAGEDDETETRTILVKLFEDLGPRFKSRPGGYTRIIQRHERRLGDGGKTAFLELLKEGETKVRAKSPAPAPAPAPAPSPAPTTSEKESAPK